MLRSFYILDCAVMGPEKAGAAVQKLRKAKGWTQDELATRAEVDRSTINKLERGKGGRDYNTVQKVATALEVSIGTITDTAEKDSLSGEAIVIAHQFDDFDSEDKAMAKRLFEKLALAAAARRSQTADR